MPFVFAWIIQLLIFFAIVSSVAGFFTRLTKNASNQKRTDYQGEVKAPIDSAEPPRRNEKRTKQKSNRPVREEKYTRTPRARDTVRETHKPMIKDVVTIKDPYRTKEKKVSTSFNRDRLKEAIVYKEILDKPVSMRDD
ncbi:hypothetical protein SAMN04488100_10643 [Alkalibacterium putridalgicola]|uniref:Uncharacterized protein n=1 Tax=Alkalibacterium putridalgicola TaxID=426703 RepID=A0A1H7RYU2_9LACT|nr:hypothetical protein [Alkalibacterium putridalgicola]GEK88332.1 hypothetical protein APU01nite_03710 [Alkalibacterium putridalgicola]SEL65276.1 hypothetical protein SAMN04488100_10643 [Alkalibacterium putridalgicola]